MFRSNTFRERSLIPISLRHCLQVRASKNIFLFQIYFMDFMKEKKKGGEEKKKDETRNGKRDFTISAEKFCHPGSIQQVCTANTTYMISSICQQDLLLWRFPRNYVCQYWVLLHRHRIEFAVSPTKQTCFGRELDNSILIMYKCFYQNTSSKSYLSS